MRTGYTVNETLSPPASATGMSATTNRRVAVSASGRGR